MGTDPAFAPGARPHPHFVQRSSSDVCGLNILKLSIIWASAVAEMTCNLQFFCHRCCKTWEFPFYLLDD